MKQTSIFRTGAIIALLFMCFSTFGQSNNVYKSAYFDSVGGSAVSPVCTYANFTDNTHSHLTTELWAKSHGTYLPTQTLLQVPTATSMTDMINIHITYNVLYASYGNSPVNCAYPNDTNWHHIAFTIMPAHATGTDSLSLYIDGSFMATSNITHTAQSSPAGLGNVSIGYSYSYVGGGTPHWETLDYFAGNIARIVLTDSVLYTGAFTPDCVFDTIGLVNDTVQSPTLLMIPLNNDNHIYYTGGMKYTAYNVYTYMTSPCAPIDTIYNVGSAYVAHNSNASYVKGAHWAAHVNGWDISLGTTGVNCPNITYGVFTDTISDTGTYSYHSAYRSAIGDTTADTTITISSNTLVATVIEKSNISIFPNPSTGVIHISATTPTKIVIYDVMGKLIMSQSIDKTTEINLPKNTYIISANDTRYKIIVE